MKTAAEVRAHLVRALETDLIGPYGDDEELERAPSKFYLTGFLVPSGDLQDDPVPEPDDDAEAEEA